jgi:hypothetical protein
VTGATLERAMADSFLDIVFGRDSGVAVVAFGQGPFYVGERYTHREWTECHFDWPAEREVLLGQVERELLLDRVDVYVCPALRQGHRRRQGDAIGPRVVWADLDGPTADPDLLADLNPLRVQSGGPGRLHVYVVLEEPVPVAVHRILCRTLAARLGADSKWSDESLLRLPGT